MIFGRKSRKNKILEQELERRFELQEEYLGLDKPVNRIEPLVSVCTITYQHAAFIRQCLDGILMQQTSFPFELIIGEDESTDGTREICIEYAEHHPDRIRLFLRDRRLSQLQDSRGCICCNGKWTRQSSRGKYIAFCEGDDYWTDPLKLQKQVDIFNEHPDCILCGGRASTWHEETRRFTAVVPAEEKQIACMTPEQVFCLGDWVKTCTRMVPRELVLTVPLNYSRDFRQVHYLLAHYPSGTFRCLEEVVAVYREHQGGIFSGATDTQRMVENNNSLRDVAKLYRGARRQYMLDASGDTTRALCRDRTLGVRQRARYRTQYILWILQKLTGTLGRRIRLSLRRHACETYLKFRYREFPGRGMIKRALKRPPASGR